MRAAEMRAAEIIAEQERKAELEIRRAKARAREAEISAAKAKEREKLAFEKAELERIKAEKIRLEKEMAKLETNRAGVEAVVNNSGSGAVENKNVDKPMDLVDKNAINTDKLLENETAKLLENDTDNSKDDAVKKKNFVRNPCDSPSAKFLSTCKK